MSVSSLAQAVLNDDAQAKPARRERPRNGRWGMRISLHSRCYGNAKPSDVHLLRGSLPSTTASPDIWHGASGGIDMTRRRLRREGETYTFYKALLLMAMHYHF
jgi:hypothetical protein